MLQKAVNINEAIQAVKSAGPSRVRAVPMEGQNVHTGTYQIEIADKGSWHQVVTGLPKSTAESIIAQATSRVLMD